MFDFRRIFARNGRSGDGADPASDYHPSDGRGEGLEIEYQQIVADHFRRFGISRDCVTLEVKRIGQGPGGFDVLACMVRLNRWERVTGFRLLLGLPVLEAKVRKAVRATWLADYSHFAGLWLHASEQLEVPSELRDAMSHLAPLSSSRAAVTANGGAANDSSPASLIDSWPRSHSSSTPHSAHSHSGHPHSAGQSY